MVEPDLTGMLPEVVLVDDREGGQMGMPLPEAKVPKEWAPLEVVI